MVPKFPTYYPHGPKILKSFSSEKKSFFKVFSLVLKKPVFSLFSPRYSKSLFFWGFGGSRDFLRSFGRLCRLKIFSFGKKLYYPSPRVLKKSRKNKGSPHGPTKIHAEIKNSPILHSANLNRISFAPWPIIFKKWLTNSGSGFSFLGVFCVPGVGFMLTLKFLGV